MKSISDAQSNKDRRQLLNENVAFYARMNRMLTHNYHTSQTLKFDDAALNVGNGYNSSTSTFTAPVHGIYVFMCSIHGYNPKGASFNVKIMHNTDTISRFRSDGIDQTSGNAILYLIKGDRVYLIVENGRDISIYGHNMSTFAGFLQQLDFTASPDFVG